LDVDLKKFELVKSCLDAIQAYGGLGFKVRVCVIEVPRPDYHSAVDGAKRVEGTVIEAAAYLYARFFFWFRSAEREGEAKIKCCADMVLRIV